MTAEHELKELVTLLADCLFDRGVNVRDWPEDECELHRNGDWGSFEERHDAVQTFRFEKAAIAITSAGWSKQSGLIQRIHSLCYSTDVSIDEVGHRWVAVDDVLALIGLRGDE